MRKNRRPVVSSGHVGLMVAAAAVAGGGVVARGQNVVTWVGTAGNYVDGANWSSGVTPANANNEYLQINNGGTALVSSDGQGAFLHLGYQPGDVGNLQLTGGTLTLGELRVGGRETIPDPANPGQFIGNGGGTGTVVQGGTSTLSVSYSTGTEPPVQSLYVGDSGLASGNTANGSYTIKDSAYLLNGIATDDQLVVGTGPGARGTFTQQDNSTVTSTGTVVVGRRGATGSYSISGGTLSATANALVVGDGDRTGTVAGTIGSFTQTGGAVTVKGADIGRRGGTGTYTISAGTLNVTGQLNVGTTNGSATPDFQSPSGTLSLTGTGSIVTSASNNVFIGFNSNTSTTSSATGSLVVSGGTMSFNSSIVAIGSGLGASGSVSISAGTLTSTSTTANSLEFDIGRNSGNGSVELSGTGVINCFNFYIGGAAGTTAAPTIGRDATATISGGTLTTTNLVLSATANANGNSTRTFNMTGGTVTAGTFNQNTSNPGSAVTRVANISGGTLTVTGNTTGGFGVVYNLTGGTQNFQGTYSTNASALNIGGTANVTINSLNPSGTQGGSITLSGGTLTCPDLHVGFNSAATPATFTQTGGTLNATNFYSGGTATKVNLSGGTINIGTLNLSNGTTLTTDNDLSLPSNVVLGTTTTPTTAAGSMTINVNTGSLTLSGPVSIFNTPSFTLNKAGAGTLTLSGAHSHTAAATITASAGTLNLNVDVGPNTAVNANGGATTFNASQTLTALNVANGATATLGAGGSRTLATSALNLNSTGTLDLTNNALSVPSANLAAATLRSYLASAYNGGAWNGASGLTSTTARNRADHATGLGYYDDGTRTLVKYTWMGDLNLDGRIDGDDYVLMDRGFALHLTSWVNGDVNYDGSVTVADYAVMDAAFGHQSGGLSPEFLAAREAQFGDAYVAQLIAAVPEPGALSLLATAALPVVTRRRRRG